MYCTCVCVQARPLLSDGKTEALVDPRLGGDYDGEQARRVAFVASLCVRAPATWRPSMTEVRASRLCRVVVRWWRSLQLTGQSRVAGHRTDSATPVSASEAHYCQLAVFFC